MSLRAAPLAALAPGTAPEAFAFFVGGGMGAKRRDQWLAMTNTGAPTAASKAPSAWTGSQMAVWGGTNGGSYINTGGLYDPATDVWTSVSATGAPAGRYDHTLVLVGSKLIIWGGFVSPGTNTNTGSTYDLGSSTWTATSTTGAPTARKKHGAVVVGSGMYIWGGQSGGTSMYRYDWSIDSWATYGTGTPPATRYGHSQIVGQVSSNPVIIVWGGFNSSVYLNSGGVFNATSNGWVGPTNMTNAPAARDSHSTIWTGSQMIVWGGTNGTNLNTGGRYDCQTDSWAATSMTNAPTARQGHSAVWDGRRMIIWGGYDGTSYLNDGAAYDPATDSWSPIYTVLSPPAVRALHSAVWTGKQMVIWGGANPSGLNTGGRFG